MVAMLAAVDARWPAFLILSIYIAMMVGIAVFASRRATSLNSFYLNDRGMGFLSGMPDSSVCRWDLLLFGSASQTPRSAVALPGSSLPAVPKP